MSTLNSVLLAQWAYELEKDAEDVFEREIESVRKNEKKITCWVFVREWWLKFIDSLCNCDRVARETQSDDAASSEEF